MTSEVSVTGKIITFYSYKGGTGRSMALANVGYLLARHSNEGLNKRVLVIDWDLEAPGLERFFYGTVVDQMGVAENNNYDNNVVNGPGLIDFLWDVHETYDRARTTADLSARASHTVEAFEAFNNAMKRHTPYVLECNVRPAHPDKGVTLHLMKAGRYAVKSQKEYINKVRNLDWERFFERYGSFFVHFRQWLTERYNFVLIDSRTGLTDIGDICTRVLPEVVVAVFVPNRQNIDGVVAVIKGAMRHRRRSRDPRPLVVFPLAARIDPTQSSQMSLWRRGGEYLGQTIVGYQPMFETLFIQEYELEDCDLEKYFSDTQVVYDGDYAFGERLAARDDTSDRLTIGYAYEKLAARLTTTEAPWEEPDEGGYRPRGRRIFLAYAREDSAQVRKIYDDLKARGLEPWLDQIDLLPGQLWKVEIPKAISQAAVILACLSTRSVAKVGYLQKELRLALSAFAKQPPGSVFLIPVRLDDCNVPDLQVPEKGGLSLRDIQFVDLFEEGGFDRLVRTIEHIL